MVLIKQNSTIRARRLNDNPSPPRVIWQVRRQIIDLASKHSPGIPRRLVLGHLLHTIPTHAPHAHHARQVRGGRRELDPVL